MPVWAAGLLMSVIFALLHFSLGGFNSAFVVDVTLTSIMFLALRYASGSLWFHIGFHGAWDWSQTYFVGLSTTGSPGDPALVRITQTGPALWVGDQQAIESGLTFLLIDAVLLTLALMYAAAVGRSPPWLQRLPRGG
jgi:membrane protease YdiL (CAAX protease family)